MARIRRSASFSAAMCPRSRRWLEVTLMMVAVVFGLYQNCGRGLVWSPDSSPLDDEHAGLPIAEPSRSAIIVRVRHGAWHLERSDLIATVVTVLLARLVAALLLPDPIYTEAVAPLLTYVVRSIPTAYLIWQGPAHVPSPAAVHGILRVHAPGGIFMFLTLQSTSAVVEVLFGAVSFSAAALLMSWYHRHDRAASQEEEQPAHARLSIAWALSQRVLVTAVNVSVHYALQRRNSSSRQQREAAGEQQQQWRQQWRQKQREETEEPSGGCGSGHAIGEEKPWARRAWHASGGLAPASTKPGASRKPGASTKPGELTAVVTAAARGGGGGQRNGSGVRGGTPLPNRWSAAASTRSTTDGSKGFDGLTPRSQPPLSRLSALPQPYQQLLRPGRYVPACRRTTHFMKISGVDPEQMAPGWEARLNEVMAAQGMQLVGACVRRGCVELVVDLVQLRPGDGGGGSEGGSGGEAASGTSNRDALLAGVLTALQLRVGGEWSLAAASGSWSVPGDSGGSIAAHLVSVDGAMFSPGAGEGAAAAVAGAASAAWVAAAGPGRPRVCSLAPRVALLPPPAPPPPRPVAVSQERHAAGGDETALPPLLPLTLELGLPEGSDAASLEVLMRDRSRYLAVTVRRVEPAASGGVGGGAVEGGAVEGGAVEGGAGRESGSSGSSERLVRLEIELPLSGLRPGVVQVDIRLGGRPWVALPVLLLAHGEVERAAAAELSVALLLDMCDEAATGSSAAAAAATATATGGTGEQEQQPQQLQAQWQEEQDLEEAWEEQDSHGDSLLYDVGLFLYGGNLYGAGGHDLPPLPLDVLLHLGRALLGYAGATGMPATAALVAARLQAVGAAVGWRGSGSGVAGLLRVLVRAWARSTAPGRRSAGPSRTGNGGSSSSGASGGSSSSKGRAGGGGLWSALSLGQSRQVPGQDEGEAAAEEAALRAGVTAWNERHARFMQAIEVVALLSTLARFRRDPASYGLVALLIGCLRCAVSLIATLAWLASIVMPATAAAAACAWRRRWLGGASATMAAAVVPARYTVVLGSKFLMLALRVPPPPGWAAYSAGLGMVVSEGLMLPAACLLPPTEALLVSALRLPLVAVYQAFALATGSPAGGAMPSSPSASSHAAHGLWIGARLEAVALATTLACHMYLRGQARTRHLRQQQGGAAAAAAAGTSAKKTGGKEE